MAKALYDRSLLKRNAFDIYSLHDKDADANGNEYLPTERFRGFAGGLFRFISSALKRGRHADIVILSHVNLLPVGWLIKKISPRTRLMMMAHGIEIWEIPMGYKKKLLGACDRFLCVSSFTRLHLMRQYNITADVCHVLNNCLDAYMPSGNCLKHTPDIRARLGLNTTDTVLFTLARMKASERYKGYDKVIDVLPRLKTKNPNIKYVIGGKADTEEYEYVRKMIQEKRLDNDVVLTGFISDEELPAYFGMADVYIMPSYNEGFGISFIEALHYGLPVIAGNMDGSNDVMISPSFGLSVNPMDTDAIAQSVFSLLGNLSAYRPDRNSLQNRFGFDAYKEKLENILAA